MINEQLTQLSKTIFPEDKFNFITADNQALRDRFTSLPKKFSLFEKHAAPFMDSVVSLLPDHANDFLKTISVADRYSTNMVRRNVWTLALDEHLLICVVRSKLSGDSFIYDPSFTAIRNLGNDPVSVFLCPLGGEEVMPEIIPVEEGGMIQLLPGEDIIIDGTKNAFYFDDDGGLLLLFSTFSFLPYTSVYSKQSGKRSAVFSSDSNISMLSVAFRLFASQGFSDASSIVSEFSETSIKEIQWAVMNFYWRVNHSELDSLLEKYSESTHKSIRELSRQLIVNKLRSDSEKANEN